MMIGVIGFKPPCHFHGLVRSFAHLFIFSSKALITMHENIHFLGIFLYLLRMRFFGELLIGLIASRRPVLQQYCILLFSFHIFLSVH